MASRERPCRECGKTFERYSWVTLFCSTRCRQTFNNRRRVRGAEVYDTIMSMRYDTIHPAAKADLEELLASYRRSDGERKTWQPWDMARLGRHSRV